MITLRVVAAACTVLFACNASETYSAHGVVQDLSVVEAQVMIAHDEVEGLMPAMTMNFSVATPDLLANLEVGDVIDFELSATDGRLSITDIRVVGHRPAPAKAAGMSRALTRSDPAPRFDLIDHRSKSLKLEDLAGKALLLDFVFTRCAGPCPILTSRNVAVERLLSEDTRERSHFVSISIDPARDTPADLARYGRERGADLDHWSFLTGEPEVVSRVVREFGVGTTRSSDGVLQHIIVSFLIDPSGQIVKRYLGSDTPPEEIATALEDVARLAVPTES